MKELIKLSDGNPGAATCLVEILKNSTIGSTILQTIIRLDIKGTDIYVMWSDLCNKDLETMFKLCTKCPPDILKEACSKQDYSGRDLVKDYLE